MKKWMVVAAIFTSPLAFGKIPVNQIKSECSGMLFVQGVSNPSFSPGEPPHGRWNGIPPHAGFDVKAEFWPTHACHAFLTKYQLGTHLSVSVTVPAVSLEKTKQYEAQLPGQVIEVEWKQIFPYAYGDILPFYPAFHEETLMLSGTLDHTYSVGEYFPVDTEKTYGVPSLEQLSDIEKLNLASDIVDFELAIVKQPGWNVPFVSLLASIEPAFTELKAEYLATLISLFQSLDPDHVAGFFFEFYVGGSEGEPIAEKINSLGKTTNSLTHSQLQKLSTQFPSLLVIGAPDDPESPCLPTDADLLKEDLKAWANASLNYEQKDGAQAVAAFLTGEVAPFEFCMGKYQSDPEIVALAKALYQKLL